MSIRPIKIYKFYEAGSIPGVPGTFNAGQVVQIDTDTNEIIEKSMMPGYETEENGEGTTSLPLDTTSPEEVQKPIFTDPFALDDPTDAPTPEEGG